MSRLRALAASLGPTFLTGALLALVLGRLRDPDSSRTLLLLAGGAYAIVLLGLIRLFPVARWAWPIVGLLCGPVPAALFWFGAVASEERLAFCLASALLGLLVGAIEAARSPLRG
jgi:hypothetical protein